MLHKVILFQAKNSLFHQSPFCPLVYFIRIDAGGVQNINQYNVEKYKNKTELTNSIISLLKNAMLKTWGWKTPAV